MNDLRSAVHDRNRQTLNDIEISDETIRRNIQLGVPKVILNRNVHSSAPDNLEEATNVINEHNYSSISASAQETDEIRDLINTIDEIRSIGANNATTQPNQNP